MPSINVAKYLLNIPGYWTCGKSSSLEFVSNFFVGFTSSEKYLKAYNSWVLNFRYAASRKSLYLSIFWRFLINFTRILFSAQTKRNSGSLWRSAMATTSSEGGIPGRIVLIQELKLLQTNLAWAQAKYCKSPCVMNPAWTNTLYAFIFLFTLLRYSPDSRCKYWLPLLRRNGFISIIQKW